MSQETHIVTYPDSLYNMLSPNGSISHAGADLAWCTAAQYATKLKEMGLEGVPLTKIQRAFHVYPYRVIDITKYRVAKLVHGI